MSRLKVVLLALFAVFALSAVAVASASASVWSDLEGHEVTETVAAKSKGTIILEDHGGTLGSSRIECTGFFEGTVGPTGKDLIKLVESSTGEKDLIAKCKVLEGFCGEATVHALNLPWTTQLVLIGGVLWDEFSQDGKGAPKWNVLCSFGIQVACEGNEKAKWIANKAAGAEFSYEGAASNENPCTDGGKGTIKSPSPGVTEGFLAL